MGAKSGIKAKGETPKKKRASGWRGHMKKHQSSSASKHSPSQRNVTESSAAAEDAADPKGTKSQSSESHWKSHMKKHEEEGDEVDAAFTKAHGESSEAGAAA